MKFRKNEKSYLNVIFNMQFAYTNFKNFKLDIILTAKST